jgi:hypothetical protein
MAPDLPAPLKLPVRWCALEAQHREALMPAVNPGRGEAAVTVVAIEAACAGAILHQFFMMCFTLVADSPCMFSSSVHPARSMHPLLP